MRTWSSRPSRSRRPGPTRSRSATPAAPWACTTIQAYLNSYVKQGTSNITIGTATDISSSSFVLGPGNADRLAVVGSLPAQTSLQTGDVFVSARYEVFYDGTPEILRVDAAGNVVQRIAVNDPLLSLSGVELSPYNNMLYAAVTTSFNDSSVSGELLEFDPASGKLVATITLPDDPANNFFYYPYGFSHRFRRQLLDRPAQQQQHHPCRCERQRARKLLHGHHAAGKRHGPGRRQRLFLGLRSQRQRHLPAGHIERVNLAVRQSPTSPDMTKIAATGGVWEGDYVDAALRFDDSGNLLQQIGFFGSIQAQSDSASSSANIWTSNFNYWDLFKFDQSGNQLLATFVTWCAWR